jgi:hypothetical protein
MASRSRARGRRGAAVAAGRAARSRAPGPGARGGLDLGALLERVPGARALAARPALAAALLLALLVLVYLWPALVGGDVLSPIAVLYKLPPWQPYRPADVASFENYLLADVPLAIYPWREFAREAIRSGHLPLWNPRILAGVPFYTNSQNGIFTPFNLPDWILPLNDGLGLSAALKLWAGGFGTYLFVRELRLGFLPGMLAGVAYAFCALNILWLTPETLPAVAVMLPWMLWLIERLFVRDGGLGPALGLAVVTAVALGGGHPGTQVHVMVAAGAYALLRAAFLRSEGPGAARWRPLAFAGGGLTLGAMLMGAMLVPEALSSHGTVGTAARSSDTSILPGLRHMPFGMARTILFPDWWGRPSAFETANSPVKTINLNYGERTFYAGVVTVLLACVGLGWRGAWRRMAPFGVMGALAIAITLHMPGLFQLVEHLPVIGLVQNQRLHFVFELAVAVLGAFGLHAVLERPAGKGSWRVGVSVAAVLVGFIAWGASGASFGDAGRVVRHFLTGRDFARTGVVELTSVAWFLLFAVGVGAAFWALRRWPQRRVAIGAALVLLAAFDMLHFAHGYNPMGPASKIFPPRTPAIAYLQRHARDGRVAAIELAFPPDWSMRYGLNDVRGYDPPYPTQRFFRLWREASPDQQDWMPMTIDALNPPTVRVLGALGVRYILGPPGMAQPSAGGDPAVRALRRVYAGREATIFASAWSAPRAMVAPAVQVVPDEEAARAAVVAEGFDPRRAVVVEGDERGATALSSAPPAHGTVTVAHEERAGVTLRTSLDRQGLVVLGDDFTAGWHVRVDGHAARALHVDDVMRGVVVPAGRHEVAWSYAVPGLDAGVALSVLGLVALAGSAIGIAGTGPRRRWIAAFARPHE